MERSDGGLVQVSDALAAAGTLFFTAGLIGRCFFQPLRMRSRSSAAAASVNVMAAIRSRVVLPVVTRFTTRPTRLAVLPVPALASTNSVSSNCSPMMRRAWASMGLNSAGRGRWALVGWSSLFLFPLRRTGRGSLTTAGRPSFAPRGPPAAPDTANRNRRIYS